MVLKNPIVGRCSRSTAAAAWACMTAVGAGLAAEEVLTAWWLEERWCVGAGHMVKTVEEYSSAGSS